MSDYRSRQRIVKPDIYAGKNMNDPTTQPIEVTVTLSEIEAACVAYREHQQRVGGSASFEGCMAAALGSLLRNRACQPAAEASDDLAGKLRYSEVGRVAALDDRDGWKLRVMSAEKERDTLRADVAALRAEVVRLTKERDEARQCGERLYYQYSQATGKVVTCAFCGHQYADGAPTSQHERLTAHVLVCEKHPLRAIEAERDTLRQRIAELEADMEAASGALTFFGEHLTTCPRSRVDRLEDAACSCGLSKALTAAGVTVRQG